MIKFKIAFLALLFWGCKKNETTGEPIVEKGLLLNKTITVSGIQRNYNLFIPKNPANAPIVFLFHGNGGSHDELLGTTGGKAPYKIWLDIAEQENLIIVAPNGTLGSSNSRGWNDCRSDAATNPTTDDVLFISNILANIKTTYNANSAKTYATGTSNGGHFCIRLAQEMPDKITAFAAVVAANSAKSQCSNATVKVSALFMNGTRGLELL